MDKPLPDYVSKVTHNRAERMTILRSLTVPEQAAVFEKLSPYVQQSIIKHLRNHEIVNLLDQLDLRQAEHILARIPNAKRRERIVRQLQGEVKEKMEYFLRFHPKASMALINFNYLYLDGSITIARASDIIANHYNETGRYPEALVHEEGRLIGEIPLSVMVRESNNSRIKSHIQTVETIPYQSDVNDIIDKLVSTEAKKLVILDHDTSVLGIVYADAARTLFGNLPAESLYDFAGVDDSERPFDSVARKVKSRYKWLILNLFTCFLAGSVVLGFQDTLNELTILSVYIPIVAGMGGNAATQSFAIMVRGLTLGSVSLQTAIPALWKEIGAGIINGVIIGSLVAIVSLVWNDDPILGLVVGAALIGAHLVAAIAGTMIPLVMKHLGKDPAATSTIFITTATDVLGLLFLLGLASFILLG